MIYLHNSYDVRELILSVTLELLEGTNPDCQLQLHLLPTILLHHNLFLLGPSSEFLQSVHGWEKFHASNSSVSSHFMRGRHNPLANLLDFGRHVLL